jgi:hypothetical protein
VAQDENVQVEFRRRGCTRLLVVIKDPQTALFDYMVLVFKKAAKGTQSRYKDGSSVTYIVPVLHT